MKSLKIIICAIYVLNLSFNIDYTMTFPLTKLSNLKCESFDPDYMTFTECRLRVIKRGLVGLNVQTNISQLPMTTLKVNSGLYTRATGFVYNATSDLCGFFKRPSSVSMKIAMAFITPHSNINHTCPYNHDLIIKNLILSEDKFSLLPLPAGEYLWQLALGPSEVDWKFGLKIYFTRSE